MKYFGGKVRVGKEIANLINDMKPDTYHEPFCGMYGVGRHVVSRQRSGADTHTDLICLLHSVQTGWVGPENVSEAVYQRQKKQESNGLRGFVGFGCSFGGKFFGGYARDKTGRNYAKNASRTLVKLAPMIKDVVFFEQNYLDYVINDDIIYCDPPYMGTTGFSQGQFNSNEFWEWVREISKETCVLVSEYKAPSDFKVIWQKSIQTDMNSRTGKKLNRIEKLFQLK